MKKYLLLLAGCPATGKSYLTQQIKTVLSGVMSITPDEAKETLADSVGFDSLAEKAALEKWVWSFYYEVLEQYMGIGKRIILSEYPFSDKQKMTLAKLAATYDYQVITIRLVAEFETLWQRRQARDLEPDRHLSHLMTHYHYGDELKDRRLADNHITKEYFRQLIEARGYHTFSLGKLYELEVSDFSKVDYPALLNDLSQEINGTC